MSAIHIPIMVNEILTGLAIQSGQTVVDGTFGGGGHSRAFVERVGPTGRVLGLDRDPQAVRAGRLWGMPPLRIECANYADLPEVLETVGWASTDHVLLDLGLSSDQLADDQRGFSFHAQGELDLRFDPTEGEPAWRLLERWTEKQIADTIYQYGEERCSRSIARRICEQRRIAPLRDAAELAELVRRCVPRGKNHQIDPATRTFQALRIAVNQELQCLETALKRIPDCLKPGGRLAIMSFHSLEDRLVKQAFASDPRLKVLTRKPLRPTEAEVAHNSRSRSTKLRIAERVSPGQAK